MSAKHDYELRVTKGKSRGGSWLRGSDDRVDIVEIVEIASGEVVLLWDRPARAANRMAHAIRADLDRLDADEFMQTWSAV